MSNQLEIENEKTKQEIAKTTSEVVGAIEKFGGFISKYAGSTLEAGLGIFEDKLKYMRWERQHRFIKRATEFLEVEGFESPKIPIPLKLVVPLLESASMEEDDALQDLYAKLLVNSTLPNTENNLTRSYIDTLERFTPKMAEVFHNAYSTQLSKEQLERIVGVDASELLPEDCKEIIIPPGLSMEMQLAYDELHRLGCLRVERFMNNNQILTKARLTLFGIALYDICTLPSEKI